MIFSSSIPWSTRNSSCHTHTHTHIFLQVKTWLSCNRVFFLYRHVCYWSRSTLFAHEYTNESADKQPSRCLVVVKKQTVRSLWWRGGLAMLQWQQTLRSRSVLRHHHHIHKNRRPPAVMSVWKTQHFFFYSGSDSVGETSGCSCCRQRQNIICIPNQNVSEFALRSDMTALWQ